MSGEEYQRTARALARETTMSDASAARIEQNLLSAVRNRELAVPRRLVWLPPSSFARSAAADRRSLGGGWLGGRRWLAAAAAVLVIAGSVALWRIGHGVERITAPPTQVASERAPIPREVSPPVLSKATVDPTTKASKRAGGKRADQKTHTLPTVRPTGFVELPWAAGLPAFESGEIVRMEVPVASLPTYGIDVSSGAGNGPVAADVLIGQDGFARAIRLVTSTVRSTQ